MSAGFCKSPRPPVRGGVSAGRFPAPPGEASMSHAELPHAQLRHLRTRGRGNLGDRVCKFDLITGSTAGVVGTSTLDPARHQLPDQAVTSLLQRSGQGPPAGNPCGARLAAGRIPHPTKNPGSSMGASRGDTKLAMCIAIIQMPKEVDQERHGPTHPSGESGIFRLPHSSPS